MSDVDACPECGANWLGDPIPEDVVEHYCGTHFKREIGIDGGYLGIYDGVVAIQCPDCSEVMPYDDSSIALELFNAYKNTMSEG